jgi:hypothetical protein
VGGKCRNGIQQTPAHRSTAEERSRAVNLISETDACVSFRQVDATKTRFGSNSARLMT